ncbi:MAG: hypothetical protein Q8P67_21380, partial [archaeon]|nr:hypothetical protein [archaeon]
LFDAIEKSLNKTPVSQLITNLYRGTLKNQIVCLECKTPSIREEHFLDLPLPLLNADSVNRSLANFVEYEKLTDSNQYSCSHCDKKVDALKGVVIKDLPPILILPLLRFEYQFTDAGFERSKNTKDFSFPLTLDMNPFTETGISPLSASLSSSSSTISSSSSSSSSSAFTSSTAAAEEALFHPPENPQSPHLYDLFGIVIHKGSSAGFGHYTAYLRDVIPDSGNPAPEAHWYDFDDTTVTPIATTDLLKQFGGKNECAYMLLYRARSLNATVPQPSIPDYINDEIQLEGRFAVRREERRERQLFHTELEVLREGDLVYNAVNHSVSLAPIRSVEQKVARMVPVDLRCSVADFRRQLATQHAHLGATDSSVISVLGLRGEALFCHTILETGTEHLQAAGCAKGSKLLLWNGQTLQGTPWNGQGQTLSLNLMHLLAFSTAPGEFPSTSQLISIAETATLADLATLVCAVLPPIARPSPDEIGEEEGKTEDAKKEDTAAGLPLVYYLTLLEGRTVTPLRFDNSRRLFDCRITTGATITAEAPVERLDLSIAFSIAEHRRYATEVYVFDRATQNNLEAEPLAFNVPDSTTVFNLKKLVIEKLGGVEALGCDISSVQLRQTTIGDAPADILSDESLSIQMSKVYNGARLIIEKGNSSRLRGLVSLKVVVALDDQPPHPIHEVMVNKNWSVVKCTTELLEQIGLEDDSGPFRLRRCKLDKSQQPQPDAHFSHSFAVLKDEGVFDGDSLWLERGRPKARGEFRLAFSRYTYKPFDTNPDLQITEDQLSGFLYSPSLHATVIKNTMLIHCPAFLKELCELSVNNSLSLVQLKDLILPQLKVALAEEPPGLLDPETISELAPEQVRVWAGDRLLRRETSSLLSQRIQADQSITLEVVPESLPLMPRSVLLFVHRRIPSLKSFETTHQEIMVDLETDDIRKAIAEAFAIPDPSKICMISKLVPFSLSWRVIIPDAKTAGHSASTQGADPQDSAAAAVAAADAQIPAQFLSDMIPEEGIVVDSGKRRQLSDGTPLELPTLMEQSSNSSMFFFPLEFGDDNVDSTLIDSSNNNNTINNNNNNNNNTNTNNNNHDASLTTITPAAAGGEDASSTPGVEWECSVCTLLNPPDGSLCNACDTPRPGSAPARKMPARPKPKVRLPTSHMSVARKPARVPLKSVLPASQSRKRPMETISRPFSTNNYYVRDGDVLSFKIIDDDPEHNDIFAFIPANIDTIGLVTRKKLRNREAGSSSSRISIGSRRGGEVGIQIQVDQFDDSDSSEDDA